MRLSAYLSLIVSYLLFSASITAAQTATVNVSGVVPASPDDYQIELIPDPREVVIEQNKIVTYKIVYGSRLPTTSEISIQAEWSLGIFHKGTSPTIPVIEYVSNSATNAYNEVEPIIDIVQKRITWTIPVFPGETTDQQVTFQVKTLDSYRGSEPADFTVRARILGVATQSVDKVVVKQYLYKAPIPPTNTPVPPTPIPPTPTPAMRIKAIDVPSISTNSATVTISLYSPGKVAIAYGTDPKKLSQTLRTPQFLYTHVLTLPNLQRDTTYFFKITANNTSGSVTASDLYTFRTASQEVTAGIDKNSISITSNDVHLYDAVHLQKPVIVIPETGHFTTQFAVSEPESITNVEVFLRNQRSSNNIFLQNDTPALNDMQAISQGLFSGRMQNTSRGAFILYSKVHDVYNNIIEYPLVHVRVVPSLTVIDSDTDQPIEHAKVELSYYNPVLRIYEPIKQTVIGIENPAYTDYKGRIPYVLPVNQYRVTVTALGYEEMQQDFIIGQSAEETYPTIALKRQTYSLGTSLLYVRNSVIHVFDTLQQTLLQLALTQRFFTVIEGIVLSCFFLLTLTAFSARTRLPLLAVPQYFWHKLHHANNLSLAKLHGRIIDEKTKQPLSKTRVEIINADTHQNITHIVTNARGEFHARVPEAYEYKLTLFRNGYQPLSVTVRSLHSPLLLLLSQHPSLHPIHALYSFFGSILSVGFEVLLVLSLLLTVLIGSVQGWQAIFPFIVGAIINCSLWGSYLIFEKKASMAY